MAKKTKLFIILGACAVVVAAAVVAGIFFLPGLLGWDNDSPVAWYNEYDEEFVIDSVEELYDLANLSQYYDFDDQVFLLDADLTVNEGNSADWKDNPPARLWYPIRNFAGTFDGQGHTISGLYGVGFYEGAGLFADTDRHCTVKDLRVVNSYFEATGKSGAAAISAGGAGTFDTIYTDVKIRSNNYYSAGIIGKVSANGDTKITNCWFDGDLELLYDQARSAGGIVGDVIVENGVCTVEHCLSTGHISAQANTNASRGKLMDVGGLIGAATSGVTNVDDCFSATMVDSECAEGTGSAIGHVCNGVTANVNNVFAPDDCYINALGGRGNRVMGGIYTYPREQVTGMKAYQWTTLNFNDYWAVDEEGTPVLKSFAEKIPDLSKVEREISTDWLVPGNTYVLMNYKDLLGFQIVSQFTNFADKTIKLGADIVVNEGDAHTWGENAPARVWKPISNVTDKNTWFSGTFDGQMHSISGLYLKKASAGLGLFCAVGNGATIKNLKLLNSYFECTNYRDNKSDYNYIGSIAAFARNSVFDTIYSDAIVIDDGQHGGGLVGLFRNGESGDKMTNCWFNGELHLVTEKGMRGGGLVGQVWNATLTMEHCLMSGIMTSESEIWGANEGLMLGCLNDKGKLNITDCLNAGTLSVRNGKADGNGMIYGRGLATSATYMSDVFTVTGKDIGELKRAWRPVGTKGGEFLGTAVQLENKYLKGYNAYQWTSLNFDDYWAVVPGSTPILQSFADVVPDLSGYNRLVDYSWYKPDKDIYYISSRSAMTGLALMSTGSDFKGKTIYLTADLKYNKDYGDASTWGKNPPATEWIPIGNANMCFAGTFNGNGHTISGLYMKAPTNGLGMFGATNGANIRNFNIKNSYFECTQVADTGVNYGYMGSVVAYARDTTLSGIYSDATMVSDAELCGGLVGLVRNGKRVYVNECWYDGEMFLKGEKAIWGGGIISTIWKNDATIAHCLMSGTVHSESTIYGSNTGGIVGNMPDVANVLVEDCLVTGNVINPNGKKEGIGIVFGRVTPTSNVTFRNVYNLKSNWSSVGTVAGKMSGSAIALDGEYLNGFAPVQWTNLDFAKYWAVDPAGTPMLKRFASSDPDTGGYAKMADTSWYDPSLSTYYISDKEDLYGLALLAAGNNFAGKTFLQTADIAVNTGDAATWDTTPPAQEWMPIGNGTTQFAGTYNGQGHTVSGIYLKEPTSGLGLFGGTKGATIKNLKLTNSYIESTIATETTNAYGYTGSIVGYAIGTTIDTVYSDATLVADGENTGGLVGLMRNGAKCYITNSCYNGNIFANGDKTQRTGGLVGVVWTNDVQIDHCLFSGTLNSTNSTYGANTGLIIGVLMDNSKATVTDTLASGELVNPVGKKEGNGTFLGRGVASASLTVDDVYCVKGTFNPIGTVTAGMTVSSEQPVPMEKSLLTGSNAYLYADLLDYTSYWQPMDGKTPELKSFATGTPAPYVERPEDFITADTSWYVGHESDTTYVITTPAQLMGFSQIAQTNSFSGKTVKLGADITYNLGNASDWATTAPTNTWTPICTNISSATNGFAGTFDGQGYTISGLYALRDTYANGMFSGTTATAVIKNFKLVNSYFKYTGTSTGGIHSGCIVGWSFGGQISDIYCDAIMDGGSATNVGGIIGGARGSATSISNCWFAGSVKGATNIGGFVGGCPTNNSTPLTISHCLFTGTVNATGGGGIVGNTNMFGSVTVTDCLSAGTVTGGTSGSVFCARAAAVTVSSTYATVECNANVSNSTPTSAGITQVANSDLIGAAAFTNAPSLDYTNYWVASEGKIPELKKFSTATPLDPGIIVDTSWYDGHESDTTYTISNLNQLVGFSKLSETINFAGKTVKLGADITMNKGTASDWATTAPKYTWTPICTTAGGETTAFAGTFDGQGHTISGLYSPRGSYGNGLFTAAAKTSVIKDFKLVNSYFKYTGTSTGGIHSGCIVGWSFGGQISDVYCDAIIDGGTGTNVGGIVGGSRGTALTISDCWFAGSVKGTSNAGGIVGGCPTNNSTALTVQHCLFTGSVNAVGGGGLVGNTNLFGSVTVTDCLSAGTVTGTSAGSIFCARATGVNVTKTYATTECCANVVGGSSSTGGVTQIPASEMYGNLAKTATDLDFSGYWAAVTGKTPELKHFGDYGPTPLTADTSWYVGHESDASYTITTAEQLLGFAEIGKTNAFNGKSVNLGADITLNEGTASDWATTAPLNKWTPVGNDSVKFAGTFDGKGYTISGLYATKDSYAVGMFGVTSGATIKNFKLVNSYVARTGTMSNDATGHIGTVIGWCWGGTVSDIYTDAIVDAPKCNSIGGIVGTSRTAALTISNCWFAGSVTGYRNVGGILGGNPGQPCALTISHCLFTGTAHTATNRGGGILGYDGAFTTVAISDTLSAGKATGVTASGSIMGERSKSGTTTLTDVFATAECNGSLCPGAGGTTGATKIAAAEILGSSAKTNTTLNFTDYWVTVSGKTPELKTFSTYTPTPITADTTWYVGHESDSEYVIKTAEELLGFAQLSKTNTFAGKTVKLDADIIYNDGTAADWATTAPLNAWPGICAGADGETKAFAGTFDGQYHSISGLYTVSDAYGFGLFSAAARSSVIKDVKVLNSYFKYSGASAVARHTGSIVGWSFGGTVSGVYSDAIVDGGVSTNVGGIVGTARDGALTISNSWFAGYVTSTADSAIAGGILGGYQTGGSVVIDQCLFTGTVAAKMNAGGIAGGTGSFNSAAIKNTLSAGTVTSTTSNANNGSVVGVKEWSGSKTTCTNVYATNECFATVIRSGQTLTGVTQLAKSALLGDLAKTATTLDFETYWKTVEGKTPELRILDEQDPVLTADTSWYVGHESDTTYTITTAAQLLGFSQLGQSNTFAGKTVKLGADITLNKGSAATWATTAPKNVWLPVGSDSAAFAGTFDGNGHTVSGIYCVKSTMTVGFFGRTNDTTLATIKNFKLTNSYFKYTGPNNWQQHVGGVVAWLWGGTISNVYTDAIVDGGACQDIGGIVGTAVGKSGSAAVDTISNCWFDGTVTGYQNIGGIVGGPHQSNGQTLKIEHCLFTGNVSGSSIVGGIIGLSNGFASAQITDTLSAGTVSASASFGSVVGSKEWSGAKTVCTNVYATNECCENVIRPDQSLTGVTKLAQANILGDLAKTNTALDFTNYWTAVSGKIPALKTFAAK